jgi:hypothetical protein
LKRLLAIIALLAFAPGVFAQWAELSFVDPGLRWRTLETANFEVHFGERHRAQARIVAAAAESILPSLTGLLRWQPRSRIHVVVLDSADFANGLASPVPFNYTMVFLSPPDEGSLLQNREWLELVLTHELFHLVHLDMARAAPLGLRSVFGRLPFLFPNALQPRWIVEGLAVHAESDARRSYGRLANSHFEGMMRAEAGRGFLSLAELNAGGRGFPHNRDYLYGGYFFAFLQDKYGEKGIADFIENYSNNIIPFRVHSNPVAVTGKNMDELWAEYQDWLRARFAAKVASPQEGQALERAFSLTSPVLSSDGTRWYVRADGYRRPKLVRQRPGAEPAAVRSVEEDSRVFASPDGGVMLAEPEICGNYNYYYDLNRVADDGSVKRLTRCSRARFAAPLGGERAVVVRIESGQAQVATLEGEVLYRAAPGESLTGVAARGGAVVVTSLRDGRWSLIEIAAGRARVLLSDQAIKHSPRFGEGDEVFFVADYSKVSNVWSLDRTGQLSRWTQAAHGVREISAPQRGEILLTTIEADGDTLRLYRLPEAPLEQLSALAPAQAAAADMPSLDLQDRSYSPWRSLLPTSWLPLIEIADGAVKLGVTTFGQDALGLHQYTLSPVIEVTQGELLGFASYVYDGRHALAAARQMSVNASSDGEIEAYTTQESGQWISTWRYLKLASRLYWGLGGALERERQHRVGGPSTSPQDERVLGLVAGIDTRRSHWYSEGPSHGLQLRLFAETSRGLHGTYSGDVYRADVRAHFALGPTVLSLRWNEAQGENSAEPFQLGGSQSDPATLLPILNQRDFALRGYNSGEPVLTGHRARIASVELRVPLSDVDRHAMVPPVGLNRVAMNLFYDVGAAWPHGADPDYYRSVGVELMSEVRFGYLLGADLRIGVAEGLDDPGKTMVYLRLGRSF